MAHDETDGSGHSMSFGDHLEELRKRVILAIAAPLPLAVVAYFFSDTLIGWLVLPLFRALAALGLPQRVQAISPTETIFTQLKLSFIAAMVVSAPWVVWQAWQFIAPGLYRHERRFVHLLLPGSAILTIGAVAFTYYGLLPLMLRVLIAIGSTMHINVPPPEVDPRIQAIIDAEPLVAIRIKPPIAPQPGDLWMQWPEMRLKAAVAVENSAAVGRKDQANQAGNAGSGDRGKEGGVEVLDVPVPATAAIVQEYRLSDYISFTLILLLGMVLAAQTPLVVMLLGWVGIVSPVTLRKNRRYAVMACAVAAAVLTPTSDPLSLFAMMIPMYGLYELGLVLLVLAPADAVAEGRVWSWRRGSNSKADKGSAQPSQIVRPVQMGGTVARGIEPAQQAYKETDGREGDE